ncbi:hypothetical protein KSP39_PZI021202 [Platanthera zijinensis]|uniref:Uncharacterized protein n=1 Tax=Platanthera zijinensis TaxID=2320716 RepID=A0AAP0AWW6_9ASPA
MATKNSASAGAKLFAAVILAAFLLSSGPPPPLSLFRLSSAGAAMVGEKSAWFYCIGECAEKPSCREKCVSSGLRGGDCREIAPGNFHCCCNNST